MTTESNPNTSYIGDFSVTSGTIDYPESEDQDGGPIPISEVDDHIRDSKQMVWNTFKSCTGQVK